MQARIATRTLELVGCEAMHHAPDFAVFSCSTASPDLHITVQKRETLSRPAGEVLDRHPSAWRVRQADGRIAFCQTNGAVVLTFDETFSRVTLELAAGNPQADILHYLYVMQSFAYHLLTCGGCALHSVGLKRGQSGIALAGRSGVGKSTMAAHLRALEPTLTVLCEDTSAILQQGTAWKLYGTPFCGDDTLFANDHAPLCGIVFLKKGTGNELRRLQGKDALFALLSTVPRPVFHAALCETAVQLALRLAEQIPIWQYENDGTPQAAQQLAAAFDRFGWR